MFRSVVTQITGWRGWGVPSLPPPPPHPTLVDLGLILPTFFLSSFWASKFSILLLVYVSEQERATYGPQNTLTWPASYVWSLLNCFWFWKHVKHPENICFVINNNFKICLPVPGTFIGPGISYFTLMWPAKPKELLTPGLERKASKLCVTWSCVFW
jgi:hypothetical protein